VKRDLAALANQFSLIDEINQLAQLSVPHRALWDCVAVALLLPRLAKSVHGSHPDINAVIASAGTRFGPTNGGVVPLELFE